jgi:hypothetical protein
MIESKDRSGWFGASDTDRIIGSFNTKTFIDWWLTKEGVTSNNFESAEMNAGTHWEHRILEYVNEDMEMDKQILIPELRLRINLDGNTEDTDYECKTYKANKVFKVPLKYKRQVWVQMFGSKLRKAYIVAYGLTENDYINYLAPIDKDRLGLFPIEYNEDFINNTYLPRLRYLVYCLNEGIFPTDEDYNVYQMAA